MVLIVENRSKQLKTCPSPSLFTTNLNVDTPGNVFCSRVLCLYFIRTCLFVLFVLHFAFCLYLQHTTQTSMPPGGFEPEIPATEVPQTYALDRATIGVGGIEH